MTSTFLSSLSTEVKKAKLDKLLADLEQGKTVKSREFLPGPKEKPVTRSKRKGKHVEPAAVVKDEKEDAQPLNVTVKGKKSTCTDTDNRSNSVSPVPKVVADLKAGETNSQEFLPVPIEKPVTRSKRKGKHVEPATVTVEEKKSTCSDTDTDYQSNSVSPDPKVTETEAGKTTNCQEFLPVPVEKSITRSKRKGTPVKVEPATVLEEDEEDDQVTLNVTVNDRETACSETDTDNQSNSVSPVPKQSEPRPSTSAQAYQRQDYPRETICLVNPRANGTTPVPGPSSSSGSANPWRFEESDMEGLDMPLEWWRQRYWKLWKQKVDITVIVRSVYKEREALCPVKNRGRFFYHQVAHELAKMVDDPDSPTAWRHPSINFCHCLMHMALDYSQERHEFEQKVDQSTRELIVLDSPEDLDGEEEDTSTVVGSDPDDENNEINLPPVPKKRKRSLVASPDILEIRKPEVKAENEEENDEEDEDPDKLIMDCE